MKTTKTVKTRKIGKWGASLSSSLLTLTLWGSAVSCTPTDANTLPPNEQGGIGDISIKSVSPSVAGLGGGSIVAIYGSGFQEGAQVAFGNRLSSKVEVVSPTLVQATVPAAETGPGDVAVTVRNKDGSFAVGTSLFRYVRVMVQFDHERIGVGVHPVAVIAEDVNRDGSPDIITANDESQTISVLPSSQLFKNGVNYPTPVGPTGLAVADFDVNTYRDIAVSCNNASNEDLAILKGTGGGFATPVTFSVGRNPSGVAARDLNADGKPDVVMAPRTTDSVYVLTNTTTASGISFSTGTPLPLLTNSSPSALLLQDITGDVYPEILTGNYGSTSVSVFVGYNGGTFGPEKTISVAAQTLAIAVGDLDGDRKKDLVSLSYGGRMISVQKGAGDGTFGTAQTMGTERDPRDVAVGDIDGDGFLDVVVANSGSDSVGVYLGNGTGGFDPPQTITTGSTPYAMVVADLNLDGKPDIVTANFNGNDVSILRNKTLR